MPERTESENDSIRRYALLMEEVLLPTTDQRRKHEIRGILFTIRESLGIFHDPGSSEKLLREAAELKHNGVATGSVRKQESMKG